MASIQQIQAILSYQKTVGRPSPEICGLIAGLKDLCELNGTNVEWRRGTANASPGGRPMFRNTSSSSLPASPSQFPRNTSSKSMASTPPESPSPYSPVPKTNGPYVAVRYQSQFKNSLQPVEDKILNNIILSKLNKFSSTTYNDIREFLYQILGSGEPDLADMIRQFMLMVFKKAATEEIYCALYAKLLAEISARYTVISEEMQKLQENYLEIFDDVEEVKEGQDNYEVFVEKNKNKRYRLGYSQFLAELAAIEFLDLSNLERTFQKLMDLLLKYAAVPDRKALVEEYTDCLVRMSRVLKKKSSVFFIAARKSLLGISKETIDTLIAKKEDYPSLSPKARFLLMDVRDNMA